MRLSSNFNRVYNELRSIVYTGSEAEQEMAIECLHLIDDLLGRAKMQEIARERRRAEWQKRRGSSTKV